MKESEIREKMNDGWIRCLITFEVAGRPQSHVERSLTLYVENINKDERIELINKETGEALEHEDGMFSAFAECELLVQNLETFTWIAVNFMPASVEILAPEEFSIESREVTNWVNDLLAKLHDVSSELRQDKGAKDHLTVAMNQLIKNAITLSLKQGEKKKDEIAKDVGIAAEQLDPFLEHMVEKKNIQSSGDSYKI